MANLLAGTGSLSADGVVYQIAGGFKYSPSTVKREPLTGPDGFHGWKETPVPGSISATLRDSSALSVATLNKMRDVTVVVRLANGKTIIGRNMGTTDSQEVDSMEATVEVKWEGPSVTEN